MSIVKRIIQQIFPNKIISHHICELMEQLAKLNVETDLIFISIEKESKSREFSYFTMKELITLYKYCPKHERTLYELILPTNQVKAYIDFEYYIYSNLDIQDQYIGPTSCLKLLHYLLNGVDNLQSQGTNDTDMALQQFLVLEA